MNYFLMLIILGLCGGGYYEYTVLQKKDAADQQQLSDLGAKIDTLQSDNKKLDDDKTQLKKSMADAQSKITDLTAQIQAAQSELAETKQTVQALQAEKAKAAAAAATPAAPPPPTNSLGTITTQDGKTFQNCLLLKVEADGIVVNHSEGITKMLYRSLPAEMQKKFGYDPLQGTPLTEAQVQFQEAKRQAAAEAAGN